MRSFMSLWADYLDIAPFVDQALPLRMNDANICTTADYHRPSVNDLERGASCTDFGFVFLSSVSVCLGGEAIAQSQELPCPAISRFFSGTGRLTIAAAARSLIVAWISPLRKVMKWSHLFQG